MNDKIKKAKKTIEEKFGKDSVFLLNDEERGNVDVVPTGIMSLDNALGCGGIPLGRIVEFVGDTGSGKTSLALHIISQYQKQGLICSYVDAEHALDMSLAEMLGVNLNELLVTQPMTGEEGLEQVETFVRSGDINLIVIDSVAALTPSAEIDGTMSDSQMGLQARLMGKAMRKLTSISAKGNTTLLFINQYRQKIGVFFGSDQTTPGGNALKFYSTLRLEISKNKQVKEGVDPIGHTMSVKIIKNKLAKPSKKIDIPVVYGHGFDILGDIVNFAIEKQVIEVSGNTHSFEGEKIAVGINRTKKQLAENVELFEKIVEKLNKVTTKTENATTEKDKDV